MDILAITEIVFLVFLIYMLIRQFGEIKVKLLNTTKNTIENLDSKRMEDFIGKTPSVKECKRLETIGEKVQLIIRAMLVP